MAGFAARYAPDSVIYVAGGVESARARKPVAQAGLDRVDAVPGTAIRVASTRVTEGISGLTDLQSSR
jgi:hypothetical protein